MIYEIIGKMFVATLMIGVVAGIWYWIFDKWTSLFALPRILVYAIMSEYKSFGLDERQKKKLQPHEGHITYIWWGKRRFKYECTEEVDVEK